MFEHVTLKLITKPYLAQLCVGSALRWNISVGEDEFLPPRQVPFAPLGDSLHESLPPGLRGGEVRKRAARGLHQLQRGVV